MASKMADALKSAYDDGVREGEKKGYEEVLQLLQDDYMLGDYPRGSVEAEAVLHVTRRIGTKMREKKVQR